MIAQLMEQRFRSTERKTGESVDFLRDIYRASGAALVKFALFLPMAAHRRAAPADAYHLARLVAVLHEDCGPCLQTVVTQARRAGVNRDVIRATITGEAGALGDPLAIVHRFAEAVVSCDPEAADLSNMVADQYGNEALVDLALAIASTRVFPTLKRALGHARSCAATAIDV